MGIAEENVWTVNVYILNLAWKKTKTEFVYLLISWAPLSEATAFEMLMCLVAILKKELLLIPVKLKSRTCLLHFLTFSQTHAAPTPASH